MGIEEKLNNSSNTQEISEAEKILGSMPKEMVHDIHDDAYWEGRLPQCISVEDYAKVVGVAEEECVEACRKAIEKATESGEKVCRDEGTYWFLGEYDEGPGFSFYGSVWAYPAGTKARFSINGTYAHLMSSRDGDIRVAYISDSKFKRKEPDGAREE